jgi:toxin YoeB
MADIIFDKAALYDYFAWQTNTIKLAKRINALIMDINRNGFMKGIGKPERLKNGKGYSRRIDEKNRLVYDGEEGVTPASSPVKAIMMINNP